MYLCECSSIECTEYIPISHTDYGAIVHSRRSKGDYSNILIPDTCKTPLKEGLTLIVSGEGWKFYHENP